MGLYDVGGAMTPTDTGGVGSKMLGARWIPQDGSRVFLAVCGYLWWSPLSV